MTIIEKIGFVASIVLPLWNIPLIVKIVKRKSAQDVSLYWVFGVWVCFILMAPSGFMSKDIVWRMFNIMNLTMFTAVVAVVVKYYKGNDGTEK